jgi:hypothetical protein
MRATYIQGCCLYDHLALTMCAACLTAVCVLPAGQSGMVSRGGGPSTGEQRRPGPTPTEGRGTAPRQPGSRECTNTRPWQPQAGGRARALRTGRAPAVARARLPPAMELLFSGNGEVRHRAASPQAQADPRARSFAQYISHMHFLRSCASTRSTRCDKAPLPLTSQG